MTLKERLLWIIRRVVGTDEILELQRRLLQQQRKDWYAEHWQIAKLKQTVLWLGSGLIHSQLDPEVVKSSVAYQRCRQILSLLAPYDLPGAELIRVGRDYDGGYVMIDDISCESVDAAYSFGIADDVSWDAAIADRGVDVYMYDHTIQKLPGEHQRFHFHPLGVSANGAEDNMVSLEESIRRNGHKASRNLLLKMDVEGSEWEIFAQTPVEVIGQFRQIVLEYHGLAAAVYHSEQFDAIMTALRRLAETHECIHVHANGNDVPLCLGGYVLPNWVEVSYVRRESDGSEFVPSQRQFPSEFDQPTFQGWPDFYLGKFDVPAEQNGNLRSRDDEFEA